MIGITHLEFNMKIQWHLHNTLKDLEFRQSLIKVIEMYWQVERVHWEEEGTPENHIFLHFNYLKNWIRGEHTKNHGGENGKK
jgi:hypothetical protein